LGARAAHAVRCTVTADGRVHYSSYLFPSSFFSIHWFFFSVPSNPTTATRVWRRPRHLSAPPSSHPHRASSPSPKPSSLTASPTPLSSTSTTAHGRRRPRRCAVTPTSRPRRATLPFITTTAVCPRRRHYPPVVLHHPAGGAIAAWPCRPQPANVVGSAAAGGHTSRSANHGAILYNFEPR
jgi:hypothetical protein